MNNNGSVTLEKLVGVIEKLKRDQSDLPVMVGFDGPGSAGKSFITRYLESKLPSDIKVVLIKRDWFYFKEPERHFDRASIERVLRKIDAACRNRCPVPLTLKVTVRGDSDILENRSFLVDRNTVVFLDGFREIQDLGDELRFGVKVVVVAADDVRRRRHERRGRCWTGSDWICGFAGPIDYVVWNNVEHEVAEKMTREISVFQVLHAEMDASDDETQISLPAPDKLLALRDYLLSHNFAPNDGIYIGDEFQLGGVDLPVAEMHGLPVFAVDPENEHQESLPGTIKYVGGGPDGTRAVLECFLNKDRRPTFVALDIDGTLIDRDQHHQKERLNVERKGVLECLQRLLNQGTHLVFITKNGRRNTEDRIATPLLWDMENQLLPMVTFYTSAMRRKSRAIRTERKMKLVPTEGVNGVYSMLTMLPELLRSMLLRHWSYHGVLEDKDIGIKIRSVENTIRTYYTR